MPTSSAMKVKILFMNFVTPSVDFLFLNNNQSTENSLLESNEEQVITGDIERDLADVILQYLTILHWFL